jgi:hypothetical protein
MAEIKGKPRGRNGGRKLGSKDKAPRIPRAEPSALLAVRVPKSLMYRIERQASLEGDPIPVFVRGILEREVV